jgi:hypothetical protein
MTLRNLRSKRGKLMKHQNRESQQMEARQRLWQALIIACQTTTLGDPSEALIYLAMTRLMLRRLAPIDLCIEKERDATENLP